MVGAIIGGALSLGGALIGGSSASSAADTQAAAAQQATQAQLNMYNTTRSDLMPYQNAGKKAVNPLLDLIGQGSTGYAGIEKALQNLPGYQFTRDQGLQAVQNSAAARGLGVSGAALKGAANYATGLADANFNNFFNNVMGVAQLGENAAAQTGAYGTQTGQSIGANIIGAGNAQAASQIAQGNMWSSALGGIGSYAMMGGFPGLNSMFSGSGIDYTAPDVLPIPLYT